MILHWNLIFLLHVLHVNLLVDSFTELSLKVHLLRILFIGLVSNSYYKKYVYFSFKWKKTFVRNIVCLCAAYWRKNKTSFSKFFQLNSSFFTNVPHFTGEVGNNIPSKEMISYFLSLLYVEKFGVDSLGVVTRVEPALNVNESQHFYLPF